MKFELDIDRRNLSDETLLSDLRGVAARLGNASPTTDQYNKVGRFSASTLIHRFGGWNPALAKAGLSPAHLNGGVEPEEALTDLRRVAEELGVGTLTILEYRARGKFSPRPFSRLFGSWNGALLAAGLTPSRRYRIPDEELFKNLERMWRTLGRQPTYSECEKPFSDFSTGTYESRFGSWRGALEAFVSSTENDTSSAEQIEDESSEDIAEPVETRQVRRRSTPRNINWRLRFLVMQRDGFRCRACGASPATQVGVRLHPDHILAWKLGGETTAENLQTLCETCNIGKSDISVDVERRI